MDSRRLLPIGLTTLVAACSSPSAPSAVPDVRGSWAGATYSWRWSDSHTTAPDLSRTAACAGVLEITSQNGSSFGGRYVIDCASGRSSGAVLDGQVGPNGQLLFRLGTTEGWEPGLLPGWFSPPCRLSTGTETYEGSVTNGSIAAGRVQTFDCPAGRVLVTATFQGAPR